MSLPHEFLTAARLNTETRAKHRVEPETPATPSTVAGLSSQHTIESLGISSAGTQEHLGDIRNIDVRDSAQHFCGLVPNDMPPRRPPQSSEASKELMGYAELEAEYM